MLNQKAQTFATWTLRVTKIQTKFHYNAKEELHCGFLCCQADAEPVSGLAVNLLAPRAAEDQPRDVRNYDGHAGSARGRLLVARVHTLCHHVLSQNSRQISMVRQASFEV